MEEKEPYVHGSMIVNAMREAGYRNEQIAIHLEGMGAIVSVQCAIRKYLNSRLLPNNPK
jgi:hypothetical protein